MSPRLLAGAAAALVLILPARLEAAATPGIDQRVSLLPHWTFEDGNDDWRPVDAATPELTTGVARRGNASMRVRITAPGEGGAFVLVPTPELLDRALVGPVTGILQGDFRFSVAVRGSPRSVGKVVRVQLNEYGGGRDDRVIASRSVRLSSNWRTVSGRGRVADDDGSGVSALAVLERARRGDAFYIDDFLVSGTPRARFEPTASTRRWAWWSYGLVWAAVAASGVGWIVYSRRTSAETGSAETG